MIDDLPETMFLEIRLPAEPGAPRATRLRRWLKAGLRCYGVRAVAFRQLPDAEKKPGPRKTPAVPTPSSPNSIVPEAPLPPANENVTNQ